MSFDLIYEEIGEFGLFQKYIIFLVNLTSIYSGLLFINSFFVLAVPTHRMKFELIYKEIGDFGLFQRYVIGLSSLTSIYAGFLFINTFFVLGIPKHRCAIPSLGNDTYAIQNNYHRNLINLTIPPADDPDILYDQCHIYLPTPDGQREKRKCDTWVYDKSIFESTLAADLNMVCDQTILKSSAQMMFFGGLLSGSFITGLLSDRFGRKTTMCASSIFYFTAAVAITWVNSYALYVFLLFSVGFFSVGNFMPAFVMSMEFVGPSMRRIAGNIGGFTWTIGNIILAGLGYAIRDWQTLQLVCALPGILFQLFWFDKIMPESPRWLFSKGRREEAEKVINRAANMANINLPEKFYDKVFVNSDKIPQGKIWHLFKSKTLCIRTLVIFFNWLVVCLSYYGLALNSGDIGGDMYLNFFLQSFMDLPACIILIILLDRTGRKPLLVASMLLGGFGCLATVFTMIYGGKTYQVATKVLAMVGKFGASAGFSMVYIYSAELFPTVVRNAGMGSSSCMARIGGMIAPYIADLDRLIGGSVGKAMPQIVFGSLSIIAGLMALTLPETLNRNLPETIQDGENFGRESNTDKEVMVNGSQKVHSQENNTVTSAITNKAFSEDELVSHL